uniref:Uncharacterized protein MANES_14G168100 n=1 Tax=Rhizophora mucronata TaxID=61149 RepID=A0A2P2K9R6_RHIMU
MGSQAAAASLSSSLLSSFSWVAPVSSSSSSLKSPLLPFKANFTFALKKVKNLHVLKPQRARTRAALEERDQSLPTTSSLLAQEQEEEDQSQLNKDVEESVKVLKNAAKTRKVAAEEVLSAFSVIEKAKIDPTRFLEILGGSKSPGRTWMLIFTAEKQLKGGRYFPLTAVQRFDAAVSFFWPL